MEEKWEDLIHGVIRISGIADWQQGVRKAPKTKAQFRKGSNIDVKWGIKKEREIWVFPALQWNISKIHTLVIRHLKYISRWSITLHGG
jgi:hypothetical protein